MAPEVEGFESSPTGVEAIDITGQDSVLHKLTVDSGGNLLFDGSTLAAGGAPLNNPAFTGVPTAPTATQGTDTTQIATTAFVDSEVDLLAPIDSPAFTTLMDVPKHATAGAPAYVEGRVYYDTTLHKLRVGGASAYETVTSA